MNKLIMIGNGGHTEACIDVIETENKYKIIGIIEKYKTGNDKFLNYPNTPSGIHHSLLHLHNHNKLYFLYLLNFSLV